MENVFTYKEMCFREGKKSLQRGMYYRISSSYSLVLISRRKSTFYNDRMLRSKNVIEYLGHNEAKGKHSDQKERNKSGKLTTNGKFKKAVEEYQNSNAEAERVRVYEKLYQGVWLYKGLYELVDFRYADSDGRRVFKFYLRPTFQEEKLVSKKDKKRSISSSVKKEVYVRDGGRCVVCGQNEDLHFDHIIPVSKGGAYNSASNIRLLCAKHNLKKGAKIE